MTRPTPPLWEEEELRAFCRAVLAAFPRNEDHGFHPQPGPLAGQQSAGGWLQ